MIADDANFEEVVSGSPIPVLVDYWATWCAPCRRLGPIVEELAVEYAGRVVVAKVDADTNPASVQRAGVVSIPTLQIMVGGTVVSTLIGARPRQEIAAALDGVLAATSGHGGALEGASL